MDKLLDITLNRYFNTLSSLGYVSYKEVDKLLVMILVYDMLDKSNELPITEEEYRTINSALVCLYGSSCMIPYP